MNPLFYVVYSVHVIILLFTTFGCLLPKRFLIYHILFICIIFLSQKVMGDKCILAVLEDKLSNHDSKYTYNYKTSFLTHFGSLLGFQIDQKHSIEITNTISNIALAISCIRLFILNM